MIELLKEVETVRTKRRLTQNALARQLEISQAHYSKVVGDIVPLSAKLEERLRAWLDGQVSEAGNRDEAETLAIAIRRDSRRLVHLLRKTAT